MNFSLAIFNLFLFAVCASSATTTDQENNNEITLVSFDDPTHLPTWTEMNDPVMGGKSTGDFTVQEGSGLFEGQVVNVPFLKAPGFIQASTSYSAFPNINHCSALAITCRSSTDYHGYKLSFGNQRGPLKCSFYSRGYKSSLDVTPNSNDFERIVIPFNEFSNCNSDATGLPITTCQDDPSVCPDEKTLKDLKMITIWGEGVAGDVHLEIERIEAVDCHDPKEQYEEEEVDV